MATTEDFICLIVAGLTFVLVRRGTLYGWKKKSALLGLFLVLFIGQSLVWNHEFLNDKLTALVKQNELPKTNKTTSSPRSIHLNQTHHDLEYKEATIPFENVTTAAYFPLEFYSGFRNQGMAFHGFVLKCLELHYSQILVESIRWKDQFGTNKRIQHNRLFDVVHWNSFYPHLPRFVVWNATLYPDVDALHLQWNVENPRENATRPYAVADHQNQMFIYYRRYTKSLFSNPTRHAADVLMLQGAFRPHPGIEAIMDEYLTTIFGATKHVSFMALHARVEPDMQQHPVCRHVKVVKLQDIFNMLHDKFPEPPVSKVIIMLGRHLLEQEGPENEIATENLHKY